MSTRLMRHGEGQKTLLTSLKQNFSPDVSESEEAFPNFEKTFEGLVTADSENKKSVLDQVCFTCFTTRLLWSPGYILVTAPGVQRVSDIRPPDPRLQT